MQSDKSSKKSSDHPRTIRFGTKACIDDIRRAAKISDKSFNKFVVRSASKAAKETIAAAESSK